MIREGFIRKIGCAQGFDPAKLSMSCEDCINRLRSITLPEMKCVGIPVPQCFRFGRSGTTDKVFEGYCTRYNEPYTEFKTASELGHNAIDHAGPFHGRRGGRKLPRVKKGYK